MPKQKAKRVRRRRGASCWIPYFVVDYNGQYFRRGRLPVSGVDPRFVTKMYTIEGSLCVAFRVPPEVAWVFDRRVFGSHVVEPSLEEPLKDFFEVFLDPKQRTLDRMKSEYETIIRIFNREILRSHTFIAGSGTRPKKQRLRR